MRSMRRRIVWLTIAIVLVIATLCTALPSFSSGPMYTRKERFGIAFVSEVPQGQSYVHQSLSDYSVASLQVGWYSDWLFSASPAQPQDDTLEYVQLLNVRTWPPDWTAASFAARCVRARSPSPGKGPHR